MALGAERCHQQRCGPRARGCEPARALDGSASDEAVTFVMQAPAWRGPVVRGFLCSRREVLFENKYGSNLSLGLIFMKALLTEMR